MEEWKSEDGNIELYNGDCLDVMQWLIDNNVKVDAIITDPPYQTTACKWDTLISFNKHITTTRGRSKKLIPMYEDEWVMRELETTDKSIHQCREEFEKNCKEGMWDKLNKLIKPNGAIVLFGSEPFSSALRMSNIKNYKYDWIWNKKNTGCPVVAKKRPLPIHENISVFALNKASYYPIKTDLHIEREWKQYKNSESIPIANPSSGKTKGKYPKTILQEFSNANRKGKAHPTQKPVALMEYLIKTYTNESELILDFTAGSFTTSVASDNTNRKSIGIELESKYFDIGINRMRSENTI